jgi:hypothetical protein
VITDERGYYACGCSLSPEQIAVEHTAARVAELESALDFLLDHVEAESRIIYKAASEGSASSTWLERSASRLVASVRLSNAANVLAKGKALTEPKTDKDEIPF